MMKHCFGINCFALALLSLSLLPVRAQFALATNSVAFNFTTLGLNPANINSVTIQSLGPMANAQGLYTPYYSNFTIANWPKMTNGSVICGPLVYGLGVTFQIQLSDGYQVTQTNFCIPATSGYDANGRTPANQWVGAGISPNFTWSTPALTNYSYSVNVTGAVSTVTSSNGTVAISSSTNSGVVNYDLAAQGGTNSGGTPILGSASIAVTPVNGSNQISVASVPATNLIGTLQLAQLPYQSVTNTTTLSTSVGFDYFEDFSSETNQSLWTAANWSAEYVPLNSSTTPTGWMVVSNGLCFPYWPPGTTNYGLADYYQRTSSVPISFAQVTLLTSTNGAPGNNEAFNMGVAFILSTTPILAGNNLLNPTSWLMHMGFGFSGVQITVWTNGLFNGPYTVELPLGRPNYLNHGSLQSSLQYADYYSGQPSMPERVGWRRVNMHTMEIFNGDYSARWSFDGLTNFWGGLNGVYTQGITNYIVFEQYFNAYPTYPASTPPGLQTYWLSLGYGASRTDDGDNGYWSPLGDANYDFAYRLQNVASNFSTMPGGHFVGDMSQGTNLNASALASGTVPIQQLPAGIMDDYMNVDQMNPYDTPATLLPAVNGTYIGVGKFSPVSITPFYFDATRWPAIQWSGLTNQVLMTHIWVTNAATISWTAYVRYFTNGFALGGNGTQAKQFGGGVFQCPVGTNDYWLLATNNWPMATMTNVTFAEFYINNGGTSSNFWVIEGTHLHAQ